MQQMRSAAVGAQHLDRVRAGRVADVLEAHPEQVRAARAASAVLLEKPTEHTAQAELASSADQLLLALRTPTRSETHLDRALAFVDGLVRSELPELLDRPGVPERFKELTMHTLHRANLQAGSYDHWLLLLHALLGDAPAHVYDLAAGTGGFARHAARHARSPLRMTSSDRSARYVGRGMRAAEQEGVTQVRWEVCDALDLRAARERGDVDLFLCTQAAHHFSPGALVQLLSHGVHSARRGVLIIDLLRSASTAIGTAILAAVSAPWPGLIVDGFQSARRAYTPAELTLLATLAGCDRIDARPFGPAWCTLHAQKL
jgi:SAM-dependent methyltransferase